MACGKTRVHQLKRGTVTTWLELARASCWFGWSRACGCQATQQAPAWWPRRVNLALQSGRDHRRQRPESEEVASISPSGENLQQVRGRVSPTWLHTSEVVCPQEQEIKRVYVRSTETEAFGVSPGTAFRALLMRGTSPWGTQSYQLRRLVIRI